MYQKDSQDNWRWAFCSVFHRKQGGQQVARKYTWGVRKGVNLINGRVFMYSRKCFLQSPLDAAETSLKWQVDCETRVAKKSLCKVNTFFSSISNHSHVQWPKHLYCKILCGFSEWSQHICNCIHWYLTSLLFEVYTKGGFKLTQQSTCVLYCGPILRYIYM